MQVMSAVEQCVCTAEALEDWMANRGRLGGGCHELPLETMKSPRVRRPRSDEENAVNGQALVPSGTGALVAHSY